MKTTSRRLTLTALVVAMLSSACQGTTLNSLHRPVLSVTTGLADPAALPDLTLDFVALLTDGPECLTLGAARGTINGEPAPKWSSGELRTESNGPGGWSTTCDLPSVHIPPEVADADQVTVAFEDDTARISATFLNLGRAPSLTITPPADGHIRPGSTILLTYAPATDDFSRTQWVLEGATPSPIDLSQRQGASVQYTIPANHPSGPATISIDGERRPGVKVCEAAHCIATIFLSPNNQQAVFKPASVHFTIEP